MTDKEGYFTYEGRHCYNECYASTQGKICQCKYDRLYEKQTMEHPGQPLPNIKDETF